MGIKSVALLAVVAVAAISAIGGSVYILSLDSSPVTYALTVNDDGNGNTSVEPIELNKYTITATPKSHYVFDGWYIGNSLLSQESTYSITLTKDTIVRAIFSLEKMKVSVDQRYEKGAEITIEGTMEYGTQVTLKQTPNNGYAFLGWYKNGSMVTNNPQYTFTIMEDCNYYADYCIDSNLIMGMSMRDIGAPTSLVLDCDSTAVQSISTYYTRNGSYFADTTGTTQEVILPGLYEACTTVYFIDGTSAEKTYSFDIKQRYTVTLSYNTGGQVWLIRNGERIADSSSNNDGLHIKGAEESITGDYLTGEDAFIGYETEYGYDFDKWKLNGNNTNNKDSLVALPNITRNNTVQAVFKPHEYNITYSANYPEGIWSISVPSTALYKENATVSVLLKPGYIMEGIAVGNEQIRAESNRTFQVTGDMNILIVISLSHNVSLSYSPSTLSQSTAMELYVTPVIPDAQYHLLAYDSWGESRSLYNGYCGPTTTINLDRYGLFNAELTVNYADGYSVTKRINNVIVDGTKNNHYEWYHNEDKWYSFFTDFFNLNNSHSSFDWNLSFRWYYNHLNDDIPRGINNGAISRIGDYITTSDPYIQNLANSLNNSSSSMSDIQRVNYVLKFVQSFSYEYDDDGKGIDDYWKYPAEMLWEQKGDCEDHAILFATLMEAMGYDAVLYYVYCYDSSGNFTGAHMAVGVSVSGASGTYTTYDGKNYFYCEATADAGTGIENWANVGYMNNKYVIQRTFQV